MKVEAVFDDIRNVTFEEYLSKLGVENTEEFLKFRTVENDLDYDNIEDAVELLKKYKNKKILILCDVDVDGLLSSGELCDFLTKLGYDVDLIIHDKNPKAHGLDDSDVMKRILEYEPSLLIIPDAGSMDNKPCKKLKNKGWECIVLDHHDASEEKKNTNAVLVNNQLSDRVKNKAGSGTLVTWHFMHLINPKLANEYISYVAISIISDGMSFLTNENITFIYRGLKDIHSNIKPFVDEIQNDYFPLSFTFGIIPKCNATIRLGTFEDKQKLYDYFAGRYDNVDNLVAMVKQYHTKQNSESIRLLDEVNIDDEEQNVLLCKLNEKTPLTGLVANKLMSKTGKPIFMLHDRVDGRCEGSVRSPVDIKDILNDSGIFNYNDGHQAAFGTSYNLEDEETIKDYLYHMTLPEPHTDVFYSQGINTLSESEIGLFEEYRALFGNNLKEPLYHIKRFTINADEIDIIGKNKTTIRIKYGNWTIIKFFCSREWLEENEIRRVDGEGNYCLTHKELRVEFVGKLAWNEWMGKYYPQFKVEDMEIVKDFNPFERNNK